jgi:hypothetical protein
MMVWDRKGQMRIAVTSVLMLAGIGISTLVVGQNLRLNVLSGAALAFVQLLVVGIGVLAGYRARPRVLLVVLGGLSIAVALLGALAQGPSGEGQIVVGWNYRRWILMVLPGILVFALWIGAILSWTIFRSGAPAEPVDEPIIADALDLERISGNPVEEMGDSLPDASVPQEG